MKMDNQKLILLALAVGERHGYDIIQEITRQTNQRVHLGPGSLFVSIKGIIKAGLIEESNERPDPELNNELRRYYRLTPLGRRTVVT